MDWYSNAGGQYSSVNNTSGAYNYAPPSYNAYSTNFEDEPPLLEGEGRTAVMPLLCLRAALTSATCLRAELGIDVGGILKKSRAILLYRMSSKIIYDLDMGGALLYVFLLGGLHLLVRTHLHRLASRPIVASCAAVCAATMLTALQSHSAASQVVHSTPATSKWLLPVAANAKPCNHQPAAHPAPPLTFQQPVMPCILSAEANLADITLYCMCTADGQASFWGHPGLVSGAVHCAVLCGQSVGWR
jgi:hypothetical protein